MHAVRTPRHLTPGAGQSSLDVRWRGQRTSTARTLSRRGVWLGRNVRGTVTGPVAIARRVRIVGEDYACAALVADKSIGAISVANCAARILVTASSSGAGLV